VNPSKVVSEAFEKRITAVEAGGMEAMANTIPQSATSSKSSALTHAFIRELLLAQRPAGYISNCRVIMNAAVPNYDAVNCPVLVLAGDEDKSAPVDMCRKIFEELGTDGKSKVWTVLNDCGHWPALEKPNEVVQEMLKFLHGSSSP
jgi:pimeloyl-ACP methyl ester carboxylesterase